MNQEAKEPKKEELPENLKQEKKSDDTASKAKEAEPNAEAAKAKEEKLEEDTKKEEKTEEKERPVIEKPSTCAKCGKNLKTKSWYYRNGKYYCNKRCWKASRGKPEENGKKKA